MKFTQLDPTKLTPNGSKQTPMDPYLTDPHGSTIEPPSEPYYHMNPQHEPQHKPPNPQQQLLS